MKLVTVEVDGKRCVGAWIENELVDLTAGGLPGSMIDLLIRGETGLRQVEQIVENATIPRYAVADVDFLPPVVRPGKVIALGRNYAAHAREGGSEPPEYPMLFHKTATALTGAHQPVIIPEGTQRVDYEGELAVIIGKTCKNVSEADALTYVAGYSVANDITARDWQRRTSQFTAGKMIDTFGPLGPALVTRNAVPDVQNLRLQTFLNGELMQDGNTRDMIFSVAFTISYISRISTLEVGDVILTGTPEGVGFARTPPVFMKPGDEISVEIEQIGRLTNTMQ